MSISPGECRIQFTRLAGSCELSRLLPGGRNVSSQTSFLVDLSFLKDPVGRFGEMSDPGDDSLGMTSFFSKSHVEA